jgi:hypothetical protein
MVFLGYLVKCNRESRQYNVLGYKEKQVRDNIHPDDASHYVEVFHEVRRVAEDYNLGGVAANPVRSGRLSGSLRTIWARPKSMNICMRIASVITSAILDI